MNASHSSRFALSAAAAATVFIGTLAFAGDSKVSLTGSEEVPAVKTAATGTGTITVGADKAVSGSVSTTGVVGTAAHIHTGAVGKSGPPVITLTKTSDNVWTVPAGSKLTDEQFASYKMGNLYINVHSEAHKPGEIRAQIKP